jgi:hypothetical protein
MHYNGQPLYAVDSQIRPPNTRDSTALNAPHSPDLKKCQVISLTLSSSRQRLLPYSADARDRYAVS